MKESNLFGGVELAIRFIDERALTGKFDDEVGFKINRGERENKNSR